MPAAYKTLRIIGCAFFLLVTLPFLSSGEGTLPPARNTAALPPVKRELRGLWVATVDNVDWPSSRNLSTRQQKEELTAIMDRAVELNLNTIILQVRPSCDAFYDSRLEPWSEYLTGQMGRAPSPFYDPLAFAVEEAHKRGLELHAWFNPYRAHIKDSKSPLAANHVALRHPELVRNYGKFLWLDPTEPATRAHSLAVIMDVVRRYDIDGVHFDDYFYPYPEKAGQREIEFPDDHAWQRYRKQKGKLSRNDWRRENVETFVREVYEGIKKEKPWVKFGISPFGIWQPKHPPEISGFNSYDNLFADSRKWLARGWVDYLAPQLYWPIDQKAQSFPVLLNWWVGQNLQRRLLCVGMKISDWRQIDDPARETVREIKLTQRDPGVSGVLLWHARPMMQNKGRVADALLTVFPTPALVPACPWLSRDTPAPPIVAIKETRREIKLSWRSGGENVWRWVVQKKTDRGWTTEILSSGVDEEMMKEGAHTSLPELIAVSAVNRYGNLSRPTFVNGAP